MDFLTEGYSDSQFTVKDCIVYLYSMVQFLCLLTQGILSELLCAGLCDTMFTVSSTLI